MYAEFFGFRELPFNITPDPRFLYLNACYQEALAALTYGIEGRKGFVSLVGEAGTGKTTLLRHLLDHVDPRVKTVLLLNPTVTFAEILEHILGELGVPTEGGGKLALLQRLNEFLIEHTSAGGNVVLLIDEAQDLPTNSLEELRLLSNLETAREKILQIILAGQPELERILRDPALRQLRQRIALHVRVGPLAPPDVAAYVRTRLEHGGATNLEVFTPPALERIAALSRGIPRLVNVLCDAALLTAFVGGSRSVTPAIVDAAWSDYADAEDAEALPPAEPVRAPASAPVAAVAPRPAPVAPPPPPPRPEPAAAAPAPPAPVPAAPAPAAPVAAPPAPPPSAPVAATPAPGRAAETPPEPVRRFSRRPAPPPPEPAPRVAEPPAAPAAAEDRGWPSRLGVPVAAALVTALAAAAYSVSWQESRQRMAEPEPIVLIAPPAAPPAPPSPPAAAVLPPPAAAAPLPRGPITAAEATALVEEFRTAYEARDVDRLLGLFATDASENGRQGREAIASAYRAVLTQLDEVRYALPNVAVSAGERAGVRAPFVISYREASGDRGEIRGDVEWAIERRDGQARIVSLNYRLHEG